MYTYTQYTWTQLTHKRRHNKNSHNKKQAIHTIYTIHSGIKIHSGISPLRLHSPLSRNTKWYLGFPPPQTKFSKVHFNTTSLRIPVKPSLAELRVQGIKEFRDMLADHDQMVNFSFTYFHSLEKRLSRIPRWVSELWDEQTKLQHIVVTDE
jgi:hypothetical protein